MSIPPRIAGDASVPSLADLRELTLSKFHRNPCNFQLEFARAILEGKKHVLLQAGCGMGKTLGFWIPLLTRTSGFLVVVTPLTLLGDQHVDDLKKAGISAINVDADMVLSSPHLFEVTFFILIDNPGADSQQDIGNGAYRVVISSPD